MTLPQKPIKWAKTLGYEVGTEAVRRWNCHDPMLSALKNLLELVHTQAPHAARWPDAETAHAVVAMAQAPASDNTELLTALKRLLAAPELHSDWGNPQAMIAERTAAREQAAEAVRKAESAL
jgi:hypothetical protein